MSSENCLEKMENVIVTTLSGHDRLMSGNARAP